MNSKFLFLETVLSSSSETSLLNADMNAFLPAYRSPKSNTSTVCVFSARPLGRQWLNVRRREPGDICCGIVDRKLLAPDTPVSLSRRVSLSYSVISDPTLYVVSPVQYW